MKSLHKRQLSLAVTAALATTLTSGLAFGQDEDIDDAADDTVEEVIVTGTRIKTEDGFGATSPVTVVNAENIKNLELRHRVAVLREQAPTGRPLALHLAARNAIDHRHVVGLRAVPRLCSLAVGGLARRARGDRLGVERRVRRREVADLVGRVRRLRGWACEFSRPRPRAPLSPACESSTSVEECSLEQNGTQHTTAPNTQSKIARVRSTWAGALLRTPFIRPRQRRASAGSPPIAWTLCRR